VWCADDDAAACGKISALRAWWDQISSLGPSFSYFPNASETLLVTNNSLALLEERLFVTRL